MGTPHHPRPAAPADGRRHWQCRPSPLATDHGTNRFDAGPDVGIIAHVTECGHADCDGDGYVPPADCDDENARIDPEAYDFIGDGIDVGGSTGEKATGVPGFSAEG